MNNYHLGSNKLVLITLQILNVPFTFPQFTGIAVIFFPYFIARNQSVNGNLISDLVCSHSVTSIIVMPRPVHNLVNSVGQYFDGMQEMTRVIYIDRVATAQGKQGIWFLLFPDRENTGNFVLTQGKIC